jgi:hypothetical protein
MRMFMKLLSAVIAVWLFYVVYKETTLPLSKRNYVFFVWLLFLLFSSII